MYFGSSSRPILDGHVDDGYVIQEIPIKSTFARENIKFYLTFNIQLYLKPVDPLPL
jgi:hypothetical protein